MIKKKKTITVTIEAENPLPVNVVLLNNENNQIVTHQVKTNFTTALIASKSINNNSKN